MLDAHRRCWRLMHLSCCLFVPRLPVAQSALVGPVVGTKCDTRYEQPRRRRKVRLALLPLWNGDDDKEDTGGHPSKDSIIVVRWDGCLADTRDWRIQVALEAARRAWPTEMEDAWQTYDLWNEYNNDNDKTNHWLNNKLKAISHVLSDAAAITNTNTIDKTSQTEEEYVYSSTTCEYALAARMILEEQDLDAGQSTGQRGKYASRFHPQQQQQQQQSPRRRYRTSRPLTVGEIAANWNEGGLIREAVRMRYHCDYRDPVPVLQSRIEDIILRKEDDGWNMPMPQVDPLVGGIVRAFSKACQLGSMNSLHTNSQKGQPKLIVTVGHWSDLDTAQISLENAAISCRKVGSAKEALQQNGNNPIPILVQSGDCIRDIVHMSPSGSTIYVIDSCWNALQQAIPLFGDSIPRPPNNIGKCRGIESDDSSLLASSGGADKNLCLCLAGWASHPTQQGAAAMNPWTRLCSRDDLAELLSPTRVLSSWD